MMKSHTKLPRRSDHRRLSARRSAGFSLIELMVAMVVFLIVAGTAFSVFDRHMQAIAEQESLSSVNLALRNATAELQLDLADSAQNLLQGAQLSDGEPVPPFSAGVIIQNNVPGNAGVTACALGAHWAYPVPSACFDGITIFARTCPVVEMDSAHGSENLASSATIYAYDPANTANNTADAACFQSGDEVLVIAEPAGAGGTVSCAAGTWPFCITAVRLTAAGSISSGDVQLTHNLAGTAAADPLGLLSNPSGSNFLNALGSNFNLPGPFVYIVDVGTTTSLKTYQVQLNPLNSADPQLIRCDSSGCAVLADQIIGFKVGAALSSGWDWDTLSPDAANYFYDASKYCTEYAGADCSTVPPPASGLDKYDFSLVRAVRVSLIARTTPDEDPLYNFANGFDHGPYLVQQAATVVDLRAITISDFQN